MVNKSENLNDSVNLNETFIKSKKSSFLFRIKDIIKKNIIAIDLITTSFFFVIFGGVYLVSADKINDSTLISPVQEVRKEALPESTNRYFNESLETNARHVIGFLPSWMVAQNIKVNTNAMTQIIYFGIGVNDNGEVIMFNEKNEPTYEWLYFTSPYFTRLKNEAQESKTKMLVAFKMFDNESIDKLISNSTSTNRFTKYALDILKKYELDGINLDFEYFTDSNFPTVRYMTDFLQYVSTTLKNENPKYLLSLDVNATVMLSDKAYDMVKMGELADQIIVMAYDYRTPSSLVAGPVAPLGSESNEHSIKRSINSLVGRVPMDKVILAVPFYGYEWETVNRKHKSTVVSNSGALATYKRVRELIDNRDDVVKHWDEKAKSPWLVYTQSGAIKQIYYEDKQSIVAKMDYVKENNLGGIAIWALGYEGKYNDIWNAIASNK